jgi:hypothetical protein
VVDTQWILLIAVALTGGLLVLLVLLVLATVWQRQGLTRQQQAMARVEESLELSRRNVELQEEANLLRQELLKNQREMLQLLRRLAEVPLPEPEAAPHALRPGPAAPGGGPPR